MVCERAGITLALARTPARSPTHRQMTRATRRSLTRCMAREVCEKSSVKRGRPGACLRRRVGRLEGETTNLGIRVHPYPLYSDSGRARHINISG